MTDQNARSYSLQEARTLTRKLFGSSPAPAVTSETAPAGDFLIWPTEGAPSHGSGSPTQAALSGAPVSHAVGETEAEPEPQAPMPRAPEVDSVEALLDWGLAVMDAVGAFVVDPQGFVIATVGDTPADHYESIGAALSFGAEQLDLVHPAAGEIFWVEMGYAESAIMAFPGYGPRVSGYLVGFVDTEPLAREHLLALVFEFGRRLAELV